LLGWHFVAGWEWRRELRGSRVVGLQERGSERERYIEMERERERERERESKIQQA